MTIHVWNHPFKFIKRQIEREFFSFMGALFTISLLTYGHITNTKISMTAFALTGITKSYSIPVIVVGYTLLIILIIHYVIKKKNKK